ncbi:TPA: hypothetical protein ONC81_003720 [Enterobacter hormaechei subsp. xiangfangensis]|nr:hypothetical protein [Enterobacter hormaechei subsp. xiangfangensis]
MYGLSLIRLGLFIALAIIASTAIGLLPMWSSRPWQNSATPALMTK